MGCAKRDETWATRHLSSPYETAPAALVRGSSCERTPVKVAVTGAAGQIGYSLLFRIASGSMLGPDQPLSCVSSRSHRL